MRLIDADALLNGGIKVSSGYNADGIVMIPMRDVHKSIKNAPTIDAEPVKHGRWKYEMFRGTKTLTADGLISCGNCHGHFFRVIGVRFRHCPDCGAKMDLVEGK